MSKKDGVLAVRAEDLEKAIQDGTFVPNAEHPGLRPKGPHQETSDGYLAAVRGELGGVEQHLRRARAAVETGLGRGVLLTEPGSELQAKLRGLMAETMKLHAELLTMGQEMYAPNDT